MRNDYMKLYWRGYRHAKALAQYGGISVAREEYNWGLNGCCAAFIKGFRRYLDESK